jgi:enterochelin esterase-like enzyme
MQEDSLASVILEKRSIQSVFLSRKVRLDIYLPNNNANRSGWSLLLLNDGQDLPKMNFGPLLDQLMFSHQVSPLCCVGIYADDRMMEYGTSGVPDFNGRGVKAALYQRFLVEELLPYLHIQYGAEQFSGKAIAGFSLGGLSAMDIVWNYPQIFSVAGVFSGSFWWRTKDLAEGYKEETDRIMHQKIKNGNYASGLRFYFTTGSLDETADRNNNGIIDSIDDTVDLIKELKEKGYTDRDISYINYEDGKHDVETWGKAMPRFLLWGWGSK